MRRFVGPVTEVSRIRRKGPGPATVLVAALALLAPGPAIDPARPARAANDAPRPEDDATYRPTVMIRNGLSLGTGTVIASTDGETLILTAAHVVASPGPTRIALHRFNVGLERVAREAAYPKSYTATVEARDADADVAILRVRGLPALPYHARIEPGTAPPDPGTVVTSLGYDHGERLGGWTTRFRKTTRLNMEKGRGERPFLLTDHPPEFGRSGGGLYREDGALVGVCVGRVSFGPKKTLGLFSPVANVHRLLAAHPDLAESVARSQGEMLARAR